MIPRGLTDDVRADWTSLGSSTATPSVFDPSACVDLPEPVRRWLGQAIERGTSLATAAEVRMHGEIRLGKWRSFTAVQRMTPTGGFIWAATARMLGMPIVGFDRYTRGSGQIRWRLLDAVPVVGGEGPEVSRSAVGRYAGEVLLYVPTAAVSDMITWRAVDDARATAVLPVGSTQTEVTIRVSATGVLTDLVFPRWGNPAGDPFAEYSFGATFQDQITFAGITLPRQVTAGWHVNSARWAEGQFIRYTIDNAHYR
jgi:hypothetical protein